MKLKNHDKKLLHELEMDSRIAASAIAKKIAVPKETVSYRIKRMLSKGIIKNFYAIINASKIGYSYYRIFLKFHKITSETEKSLIKYLSEANSCAGLRVLEGDYDMVFITTHRNLSGLKRFMAEFMEKYGRYIQQKSIHTIVAGYKHTQGKVLDAEPQSFEYQHDKILDSGVDRHDLMILGALSSDARASLSAIARKIGRELPFARFRIKKLLKKKIIVMFSASIDFVGLGWEHIQLDISLKNLSAAPSVIEFFKSTGISIFAYDLIGKYDLSVEILVKNDHELREILDRFKEKYLNDYSSYDVSHVYQEFPPNWAPFA